jgi:hypothetical protein
MQLVLQQALNGALLSVFYAMMAIGFTLIKIEWSHWLKGMKLQWKGI